MPNLLFNIAALTGQILVLFTLYGVIDAHLPPAHRPWPNLAAKALLFSLVGIYTLYAPVELTEGVIADPRGAILACATLYGGRLVGLVTGLSMIGFRLFLGGVGAWAGVIGLAVEYLCLLLLLQPALERWLPPQSYRLLLASTLAMSLLEPLSLLLIPPMELGWQLLAEVGPALGLLQFFATPLLGALIKIQTDRHTLEEEVKALNTDLERKVEKLTAEAQAAKQAAEAASGQPNLPPRAPRPTWASWCAWRIRSRAARARSGRCACRPPPRRWRRHWPTRPGPAGSRTGSRTV